MKHRFKHSSRSFSRPNIYSARLLSFAPLNPALRPSDKQQPPNGCIISRHRRLPCFRVPPSSHQEESKMVSNLEAVARLARGGSVIGGWVFINIRSCLRVSGENNRNETSGIKLTCESVLPPISVLFLHLLCPSISREGVDFRSLQILWQISFVCYCTTSGQIQKEAEVKMC